MSLLFKYPLPAQDSHFDDTTDSEVPYQPNPPTLARYVRVYQVDTAVSRMLAMQVPVLTSSTATPKLLRTPREELYHALFSEFWMSTDIVLGNEVKFESMF